jgi:phytoene dehydrogenase-like protein
VSEAVVVGSGPNGLAAAIVLAAAGREVTVYEAGDEPGGGTRSAALTLPGTVSDVCSAVHPFAVASPLFRSLPLARHGLEWIHSPAPLAHPLPGAPAALLERSVEETARGLGRDGPRYARLVGPVVAQWDRLLDDALAPPLRLPRAPLTLAAFGIRAAWPASALARAVFRAEPARALFAGMAAHSILPLGRPLTAAFGLLFAAAGHAGGWPVARGGSQAIARALVAHLQELGGRVVTGRRVESLRELAGARTVMLDVTPHQLLGLAGDRLPPRYRRALERFRYGPGAFKVDYALDGPIPWDDPACARAATVHVGGTLDEIARAEEAPHRGRHVERPFVLLAQQSLFDRDRAPEGIQLAWAYCHVPNGSREPMGERVDLQIEGFAPGFRDRILARHEWGPAEIEQYNANYVGGDIAGGSFDGLQVLFRPVARWVPYATPLPGVYLCSSSTPPGGGVHGMCGFHAARAALAAGYRRPPGARL